jgi:cephalosporin hydroxylase
MQPINGPYWQGVIDYFNLQTQSAGQCIIDADRSTLTVMRRGVPVMLPLYTPGAFREISRHWLRVGWSLGQYGRFKWMGLHVLQLPEDLIRLQEAIFEVQPDLIIETGICHGGSLLFLASLCKIIDRGQVVGIDINIMPHVRRAVESHPLAPWLAMIEGDSTSPEVIQAVRRLHGENDKVFVILDSAHDYAHVLAELELYSGFVTPGSYLLAEDGIMYDLHDVPGGEPAWAVDNPASAVGRFLATHPEFVLARPDPAPDGGVDVTFWPAGWLKRVR